MPAQRSICEKVLYVGAKYVAGDPLPVRILGRLSVVPGRRPGLPAEECLDPGSRCQHEPSPDALSARLGASAARRPASPPGRMLVIMEG